MTPENPTTDDLIFASKHYKLETEDVFVKHVPNFEFLKVRQYLKDLLAYEIDSRANLPIDSRPERFATMRASLQGWRDHVQKILGVESAQSLIRDENGELIPRNMRRRKG